MNCTRVQKQLLAYSEAHLDEPLRLSIEAHLSACGTCRTALNVLEATRPEPPTPQDHPPEFWAPMHEAVLKELEQPSSPALHRNRRPWTLVYGLVMTVAVLWALKQHSGSPAQAGAYPITPSPSSATLHP